MLRWRLFVGTLIIAVLVGLCWLDHLTAVAGAYLFPVAILFAVLAVGDALHLAAAAGLRPVAWTVYCGTLLVLIAGWIPTVCGRLAPGMPSCKNVLSAECPVATGDWPLAALALGVLLAFLGEMRRYEKPGGVTANLAAAVFAMVYVGGMLCLVIQLRLLWGIGALASLLIVVKLGDVGAYTVGRLVGRHKMAPVLSPGKTIEGAVGQLAFACLGSWIALRWIVPAVAPQGWQAGPWWGWILFGLLVGAAGMLGDLAESLVKRDVGRKDSSRWMPGFGGTLDILDSILLAAPVAYLCWATGLAGR